MAGITSAPGLAKELEIRGFGGTHLYLAERDQKMLPYAVIREIASICELPTEFFTANFSRLPEISEDPRRVIAEVIAAAVARSEERHEGSAEDPPPQQEAGP